MYGAATPMYILAHSSSWVFASAVSLPMVSCLSELGVVMHSDSLSGSFNHVCVHDSVTATSNKPCT